MSRRKHLMLIAVALTLLTVACTVGQEPVIVPDSQSDVRRDTDPGIAQATVVTTYTLPASPFPAIFVTAYMA